jgi:hypothetical protein
MAKGKNSGMFRHGIYDIQKTMNWMETDSSFDTDRNLKKFESLDVLSGLLGYKVFKAKGVKCCCCPTTGEYFALEKTPGKGSSKYNNWHFNLYGKDHFGREVLMTKDHITARSKGGSNELENLQPMCMICNTKKGSMHMKEFEANQQGKTHDWNLDHANHTIKRIKERYSLDMSIKEYSHFLDRATQGCEMVHVISNSKSYRKVRFKDNDVYCLYSSMHKTIYTVITADEMEKRKQHVPNWGKGNEKACHELYKHVTEVINEQLKNSSSITTQKELAEYFAKCKYPTLMFALWKQKTNINIGSSKKHIKINRQ